MLEKKYYHKYKWYPVYTRSRAEKKVFQELVDKQIISYLPLVKNLKQWSDRKKWVEEPLFKSYLFVKISIIEYQEVLNVQGVVKFISFNGITANIPEKQIDIIKKIVSNEYEFEVINTDLKMGDKVMVIKGPMSGLKGELVNLSGKKRVYIKIESINQGMIINLPLQILKNI